MKVHHEILNEELLQYKSKNYQSKQNLKSIFFTQINKIIQSKERIITIEEIENTLSNSKYLPNELISEYDGNFENNEPILQTLKKMFLKYFIWIGLLKFVSVIFLFTTPVLINYLTTALDQSINDFLIYSGAVLTSTLLSAITDTQYNYQIKILEFRCKSFLIQTLYNSIEAQSNLDLMNLINIDVNTIMNFFISFHEFWSLILKLIIGMTILYLQIQEAVFVGFATAIILVLVNFAIANKIGHYYSSGLLYKDLRMKAIKDFISNPKSIKFLKWENKWESKIMSIREQEFAIIAGSKWLDSLCVLFWSITNTLISSVTLYVYSQNNDLENVFTIIYVFSLLTNPLNSLPWTLAGMLQAKTSFLRINSFVITRKSNNQFKEGIEINQAELKWDFDSEFTLRIPHFKIDNIVFVGGKVGSGKSSFLLSLLNQMKIQSGYFQVNQQFSYVSQQSWLFKGTIRDNILMQSKYNDELYKQCLVQSNLIDDIQKYPEKDLFDVGPDGSKLSGGQKQRLCICRALYNQNDIYLMDDIFSSLDPQVGDSIFNNLLKITKPIIFALNDNYLQRYKKYADQIIIIKNGQVIYDKQEIEMYFQDLQEQTFDLKEQKVNLIQQETIQHERENQQDVEIKKTQKSLSFYLKSLGLLNLLWILVSLALMQISFNVYDIWLNTYINENPMFIFNNSFVFTLFMLVLIDIIIKLSRAVSFAYGNLEQAKKIFVQLLNHVIHAKCSFFDAEESGEILIRFSDDQNVVDNRFPFELNLLCNNIFNFIGTFIVLVVLQYYLILPVIVSALVFYRLQQLYRPTSLSLRRLDAETNSNLATSIFEQFKGILTINAFNKREEFRNIFLSKLIQSTQVQWCSRVIALWLQIRLQLVAGFIVLFILLFTALSLFYELPISKSTLQLLLYYSLTKISLFRDLTLSLTTCEQELVSYERQNKYCNNNIEQDKCLNYSEDIKFKDIKLQYFNGQLALKGINIEIEQGKRVAFCGRTGSGKSSILAVLFQLYEQTDGDMSVPSQQLFEWRNKVGVIPQLGFVFDGTLSENLDCSDQDLISKYVAMDGNSYIDSNSISQGMRQLISFSRVVLQNPDIICLDEATASVDQQVEDFIQQYLRECGKTIITISHRLEALKDYDRIYYLENGLVVEQGTFQELVQLGGGFANLRNC
ncbi:unnamed protein product [Paramecium pentaurelia]|uniref:ABC transporter family protein n=1 Tax=Paramecium pentaurelia TaxID=43138 RepID=A0A8S1WV51_9CILI|nr:unnamed protein product [Paramecium pentaurelia]